MAAFLSGRGGLTGGMVIPSGNLPCLTMGSSRVQEARYYLYWLKTPGQRMLFRSGRRIVYERETWTRKLTSKSDAQSQRRTVEVQRTHAIWSISDDALPVESRLIGRVPSPVPQKDPHQATGGHAVPIRGARFRRRRVNATGQNTTLIQIIRQDHSTFHSGLQRETTTRMFCSQSNYIKKTLMWFASKRHT